MDFELIMGGVLGGMNMLLLLFIHSDLRRELQKLQQQPISSGRPLARTPAENRPTTSL